MPKMTQDELKPLLGRKVRAGVRRYSYHEHLTTEEGVIAYADNNPENEIGLRYRNDWGIPEVIHAVEMGADKQMVDWATYQGAKAFILHAKTVQGYPIWIVASSTAILRGSRAEGRHAVLGKFISKYGKPSMITEFAGVMQTSEAAMCLADIFKGE